MAVTLLGAELPDGATVTVDSAPLIYFLEDRPRHAARYLPVFEAAARGDIRIVISAITLVEVVAGPLRSGNEILAAQYHRALQSSRNWRITAVTDEIAFLAARIRVSRRLHLSDAIQVATAVSSGSAAFITHDTDFRTVREIRVLN